MTKAVALLSGGLDSSLAIKLIQQQGVEVIGLHFVSIFCEDVERATESGPAALAAKLLGIEAVMMDSSEVMLALVKNPLHGYGKNLNPCIDCRIAMLRRAAKYMKEIGADFIITGEVSGQRPMSQRRNTMRMIDKKAGVVGLVVRPLCAKIIEPSLAEKNGLIDRQRLLDISGRSRKRQMALAEEFGLVEYPGPAGGCLLTQENFALKVRDLLDHGDPDAGDIRLLLAGRHYRLDENTKAIIGRNQADNARLLSFAARGDTILDTISTPGPITVMRGEPSERNVEIAARLTARYSKGRSDATVQIERREFGSDEPGAVLNVSPAAPDEFKEMRIG